MAIKFPAKSMDWPLSREEKKNAILRLYNDDVRAADQALSSGNAALEALRTELETVRRAAGIRGTVPPTKTTDDLSPGTATAGAEVERLRGAVESAAAVLRAILPTTDEDDADAEALAPSPPRPRARSVGAEKEGGGTPLKPCLAPLTPRRKPRRKVSFGGEPEREPTVCPMTDSDDDRANTTIIDPAPRKPRRDSLGYHKEKINGGTEAKESSAAKVMEKEATTDVSTSSSGMKVHFLWFALLASVGAVCCKTAISSGSPTPDPTPPVVSRTVGDPSCWNGEWQPEMCCFGAPRGNPACWDHIHTFERCCLGKR